MTSSTTLLPLRSKTADMETADSPCVLLLDLSHSALAGIDLLSFTATPKFKGIKNLPQGLHFVFCSTTSDLSVRHGAWFSVPHVRTTDQQPLFIKKWNATTEQLEDETHAAQILKWRANLGSIWKENLSPYRLSATKSEAQDETKTWLALTNTITPELLSNILGDTPNHWNLTSASSAKVDVEAIPGLQEHEAQPEKELNLLHIDLKRPWREGATGRERTDAARDHSWYLREVIQKQCLSADPFYVLGEMQFSFLMVLTLNNYSCLEGWKRILRLVLTCKDIITDLSEFYTRFLAILRNQLQACSLIEGGLFDLTDESNSLLRSLLHKFRLNLLDLPGGDSIGGAGKTDVVDELDELEDFLRAEYGWELSHDFYVKKGMLDLEDGERVEMDVGGVGDEEDETGEFAPMVVELTSSQMVEMGITEDDWRRLGREGRGVGEVMEEVESEEDMDLEEMDERY